MGVKNGLKDDSICWDCAKSCNRGCSWSDGSFTPVEGWTAIPDQNRNGVDSFLVKECPQFEQDGPEVRNWQDLDDNGVLALVERLMEITREDYIKCRPEELIRIEKFIRGKGASRLHQIQDPEKVIRELQKQRRVYWQGKISFLKG